MAEKTVDGAVESSDNDDEEEEVDEDENADLDEVRIEAGIREDGGGMGRRIGAD
jgi:hypothetical protein